MAVAPIATLVAHGAAYATTDDSVTMSAAADAYALYSAPRMVVGAWKKLVATRMPGAHKTIFLKFRVDDLPSDAVGVAARLRLTRDYHHLPTTTLAIHRVADTSWRESALDGANAPAVGTTIDTAGVGRSTDSVTFDLGSTIRTNGTYAFAVTASTTTDVASFRSSEAGFGGPRLTLSYSHKPKPTTTSPTPAPTTTSPAPAPTTTSPAPTSSCGMSAMLVPSCGVLLGGWVTSWPGTTLMDKVNAFESATGTHLAVIHDYRRPGQVLSTYDTEAAQRANTYLQLNWKPASKWADADGGNATVNGQIDAMAKSIKALGSRKIMLAVFHEPENDVSSGASGCTTYKGSAGTPAEYRAMWRNVRNRFDALGVTNVVWVMNYMGWQGWNCMVDDLWPGNDLVDWVIWDPYGDDKLGFDASVSPFYNFLTQNSDTTHNYLSKPWGLGEFGTVASTETGQHAYYDAIKSAIDNSTFPRLKMLSIFDSLGTNGDDRVRYDEAGDVDLTEVSHWDALACDGKVNHLK